MRIVVPYPPGGSTDRAARLLADALQPLLGAPVIVENRVGTGGRRAVQQVHKEPTARNVLLLTNPAPIWLHRAVDAGDPGVGHQDVSGSGSRICY